LTSDNNLDAVLQQQIMDQFRKDNEALLGQLEKSKNRSLDETKVITFICLFLFCLFVILFVC